MFKTLFTWSVDVCTQNMLAFSQGLGDHEGGLGCIHLQGQLQLPLPSCPCREALPLVPFTHK